MLHHRPFSSSSTTMPLPLFTFAMPNNSPRSLLHPLRRPARRRHHHRHRCRLAQPPCTKSTHLAHVRHHATSPILPFPFSTPPARVQYPPLPSALRHARDSSAVTFSVRRLELG